MRVMTQFRHLVSAAAVVALATCAVAQDKEKPVTKPDEKKAEAKPAGEHPRVEMEIAGADGASWGSIILELDEQKAPITVWNFVQYVEAGHYNGTIFHRVIPTFMIQGGGMTSLTAEKKQGLRPGIWNEARNGLSNLRGTVAMARTGDPHSATAQFFINVADNKRLDYPAHDGWGYCVFGKVVEGMDVVDKIKAVETGPSASGEKSQPAAPPVIKGAKMLGGYDKARLESAARQKDEEVRMPPEKQLEAYIAKVEKETGKKASKSPSGLYSIILTDGNGPQPKKTDEVQVHYTGWLLDGKKFDSSVDRGQPFEFNLSGGVIQGWLEGVAEMKVGEKRRLIIPPALGYGARGSPPVIPGNSYLVFDVELLAIK